MPLHGLDDFICDEMRMLVSITMRLTNECCLYSSELGENEEIAQLRGGLVSYNYPIITYELLLTQDKVSYQEMG